MLNGGAALAVPVSTPAPLLVTVNDRSTNAPTVTGPNSCAPGATVSAGPVAMVSRSV
jgi:hypothetical protein